MSAPTDTYNAPSGQVFYAGKAAPSTMPAWLAGKPLNEWVAIAGTGWDTSGAGGALADAFSGFVVRDDTSEVIIALAGGHGAGLDNRVVSLSLSADAPAWVLRKAASTSTTGDVAYYPDGTPASRHTYSSGIWCPQRNRLMMHGLYGTYPNATFSRTVDGFNLDNNTWDPAGTWLTMPSSVNVYSMCRGKNGDAWLQGGRWNQATDTYTASSWGAALSRFPGAYDSLRDQVFTLQFGDGQGFNTNLGVQASKISASVVQTAVTFNSSAAYTAFVNDQLVYSGMDYDPVNDKFWFYPGSYANGTGAYVNPGKVYIITPNSGAVWDMSILTLGAGSATGIPGTPPGGAGINGRFRYVPALKGFVVLPQKSSNLYFIRTA